MSNSRYTEEFKRDAVVQITDRGYSIKEVSERLNTRPRKTLGFRTSADKLEEMLR